MVQQKVGRGVALCLMHSRVVLDPHTNFGLTSGTLE